MHLPNDDSLLHFLILSDLGIVTSKHLNLGNIEKISKIQSLGSFKLLDLSINL